MARTDDLAKLLHLVEERKAKVVLVGDAAPARCGRAGRHLPHGRRRHGATSSKLSVASARWRLRLAPLREGNPSILRYSGTAGRGRQPSEMAIGFAAWKDAPPGESSFLMAGDNGDDRGLSRRCRAARCAVTSGLRACGSASGHVATRRRGRDGSRRPADQDQPRSCPTGGWSVTGRFEGSITSASLERARGRAPFHTCAAFARLRAHDHRRRQDRRERDRPCSTRR